MIASLNGIISDFTGSHLIIDVNGVGYGVTVGRGNWKTGDQVKIYTHLHVREDIMALYGFATKEEQLIFDLLLTVSGVGPKLAMSVISAGSVNQITNAIRTNDTAFFESISGLGKENSAKIIIELKNKLGAGNDNLLGETGSGDLIEALMALGYNRIEAMTMSRNIDKSQTLEKQIKEALKK